MKKTDTVSSKPNKQRKAYFNAPAHRRTKQMSSHINLDDKDLKQYGRRSVPLHKGDTVKVLRGSHKGHSGNVTKILRKQMLIEVEGVVMTKADGKQTAKRIHPSNVMITKLDLSDPARKARMESKVTKGGK